MKITGIYKITIKDKIYIGSSVNIYNRWIVHKSTLKHNKHKNPILQSYYNKYGLELFNFEVLEKCPKENLLIKEQWWIDNIKCDLNCSKIAGKPPQKSFQQLKENSIILSKLLSKKIYQYDLEGNFIREWINIKEAGDFYNIDKTGISKCCNDVFLSFYNFQWKHQKKEKINAYIDTNIKSVFLYNLKEELIKTFKSRKECAEFLNVKSSRISNSIKNKTKLLGTYYLSNNHNLDIKKERLINLYNKEMILLGTYTKINLLNLLKISKGVISRKLNSKQHVKILKKYYVRYQDTL